MWESSVDLVRFLRQHHATLPLGPTHAVLELGCGHGLPGTHALQSGVLLCDLLPWVHLIETSSLHNTTHACPFPIRAGARVCFMDLNAEVLAGVTRRNIDINGCACERDGRALLVSGDWTDASRLLRQHW